MIKVSNGFFATCFIGVSTAAAFSVAEAIAEILFSFTEVIVSHLLITLTTNYFCRLTSSTF